MLNWAWKKKIKNTVITTVLLDMTNLFAFSTVCGIQCTGEKMEAQLKDQKWQKQLTWKM